VLHHSAMSLTNFQIDVAVWCAKRKLYLPKADQGVSKSMSRRSSVLAGLMPRTCSSSRIASTSTWRSATTRLPATHHEHQTSRKRDLNIHEGW